MKITCRLFQKKSTSPDGWDSGNSRWSGVKDSGNPGGRGAVKLQ